MAAGAAFASRLGGWPGGPGRAELCAGQGGHGGLYPFFCLAVDIKTTYRNPDKPHRCNGFTLGSHGKYFENRTSTKNIQFSYGSYSGHFCLGIIYSRVACPTVEETGCRKIDQLHSIVSAARDFQFFAMEKWRIAGDKRGSGNTANIGSIIDIQDLIRGNGMFSMLGENWFDDYWMNYGKITIPDNKGGTKKITTLREFGEYRKGDVSLVVPRRARASRRER